MTSPGNAFVFITSININLAQSYGENKGHDEFSGYFSLSKRPKDNPQLLKNQQLTKSERLSIFQILQTADNQ
jgi:hypothetical protein